MSVQTNVQRGKFLRLALGLTFAVALTGAVGAAPGGKPPADTTTWVIVTKPPRLTRRKPPSAVGVQLHAIGTPDGRQVTLNLNQSTLANGNVVDAHERYCRCRHFHGSIGTKGDPAPRRCGWGCVVLLDDLPLVTGFLSGAITLERRAHAKIDDGNDLAGAVKDLNDAKGEIDRALANEPPIGQGGWNEEESEDFRDRLDTAKERDTKAAEKAEQASDLDLDKAFRQKLRGEALDLIEKALKSKERAFLNVNRALNVH